ncbi:5467_t:CDS:2, partial [Paraglomus occultum]
IRQDFFYFERSIDKRKYSWTYSSFDIPNIKKERNEQKNKTLSSIIATRTTIYIEASQAAKRSRLASLPLNLFGFCTSLLRLLEKTERGSLGGRYARTSFAGTEVRFRGGLNVVV